MRASEGWTGYRLLYITLGVPFPYSLQRIELSPYGPEAQGAIVVRLDWLNHPCPVSGSPLWRYFQARVQGPGRSPPGICSTLTHQCSGARG
ncbi:hypothetical protein EVAR_101077_1 [Eumeta japonica]|uniref:Uncharacterized protein n=1 Tax=Eumeta variegata TaxID=151549 RepID=A0A4C2AHD1_EUMVA|nr:hypothetical protein EVAR_101077_1 [Eumeta japonica]